MQEELIHQVTPELRGWFSQENPFSWDLNAFDYAPDARRFDHGTPSVLACLGSIPALRWHARQTDLLTQNRDLTGMIMTAADDAGLTLATPRPEAQRGGSVMVQLPGSIDAKALVDHLREQHIHVDCRGRILRLSPGAVTTKDHVADLFSALGAHI
jgi:kynureninase